MNKSSAHRFHLGGRRYVVFAIALTLLFSPTLSPFHPMMASVAMAFAVVSVPYMGLGTTTTMNGMVSAQKSDFEGGASDQDDDDDHRKTPTPAGTPEDDTVTPVDEPTNTHIPTTEEHTQTAVPATPTGTPPAPTDGSSSKKHKQASPTPAFSRSGFAFMQITATKSVTPQATFTATPTSSPVPSKTNAPTSTPENPEKRIIQKLIPQAPIVRRFLPYELPLAIFIAVLFCFLYELWLKKG